MRVYSAEKHTKHVFRFTSTSRKSCSFLHVAEKVSEVPNSKYHSLFFVLGNKTWGKLQRDQEETGEHSSLAHQKPKLVQ